MFYNASRLPPEPVNNSSDSTGVVVQKALRVDICSPQDCDLSSWPDWTEEVKSSIWAIVGEGIVILQRVSNLLCWKAGGSSRTI